jgi:hypothetical protein
MVSAEALIDLTATSRIISGFSNNIYFRFSEHDICIAHPVPTRGALRIVTTRGAGMRRTRARRLTNGAAVDGKSVWS